MAAKKSLRPWNPEQAFLLPPSPAEWLPEGHLAYFILDTVALLDLSAIEDALQAKDPRGERSYDPAMMLAFTRVNGFRKQYQDALSGLFLQGLLLCRQAGLVKLGHMSLDGSKVAANASRAQGDEL